MDCFIGNVVIGTPPGWDEGERRAAGPDLGTFYAQLLGQRIIRRDWVKVGADRDTFPQLAFGDGGGEPPRWPDPEYPQQMHIDIAVPDVAAAEDLVLRRGGTKLADVVYADPAGHPFCLREGEGPRIARVVIDCPSPRALAAFYEGLLGMSRVEDATDLVVLEGEPAGTFEWPGRPVRTWRGLQLAFQRADVYVPPRWGDEGHPLQLHLDISVRDGGKAREIAEAFGAIPIASPANAAVYADPAGHPFCLPAPAGRSPGELLAQAVRGSTDEQILAFADSLGGAGSLLDMVFAGIAAVIEPTDTLEIGFSVGADFVVSVSPEGALHRRGDASTADAIVQMTSPDFLRLVVRELLVDEAVATRRLQIEGDAGIVERFFALLPNT